MFHGARFVHGPAAQRAEQFHAVGEQRERPAAVGQDPADPRIPGQDAAEEQVARGAGDVEEKLQHRPRSAQGDVVGVGR